MSNLATTARRVERSAPVAILGRAGMVCYGAVHIIVALLALRIATEGGDQTADQKGAIEEIAATTFGGVVLWVLAIGLIAFAGWQVLLAAIGYRWRDKKRTRVAKRIGSVIRVVVSVSIAIAAIRMVTGGGSGEDSNQKQQTFTAKLFELPAGRLLVGAAALILIGYGVATFVSGARQKFMKDLNISELPAGSARWVRRLGMIGYLAKGVAIAIVGVLLGLAAIRSNSAEAGGLDAALRTLAGQPFGPVLLIAVALGFAAFGIYCFAAARSHRT
jgi:hypothetical protein